MSTRRHLLVLLAAATFAAGPVGAQGADGNKRVKPRRERDLVMARLDRIFPETVAESTAPERNPFVRPVAPTPEVESAGPEAPPVVVVRRLPAAEALRRVASSLQPGGSIVRGERQLVRLSGRWMAAGDPLVSTIDGETFEVVVDTVTADTFTLRLGGQTLTLSNSPERSTGGGSASFDRPNP